MDIVAAVNRRTCTTHEKVLLTSGRVVCGWFFIGLQEQKNVASVVKKFNLSKKFVDMSYGIFQQLDLDKNGAIDLK